MKGHIVKLTERLPTLLQNKYKNFRGKFIGCRYCSGKLSLSPFFPVLVFSKRYKVFSCFLELSYLVV